MICSCNAHWIGALIVSLFLISRNEGARDYAMDKIRACNYTGEVHNNIETPDGYLLTMQRIPYDRQGPSDKSRTPVLIMHGLLGSSDHFLLMGCKSSLAYMLVEAGYDVWLGNVRSVSYSRHHVTLDPDEPPYWNFSFPEFGLYDLSTLIDYILNKTAKEQLMYIGHSQGNLINYILNSQMPEYAKKVSLFLNLSPVATVKDFPHPWLTQLCKFRQPIAEIVKTLQLYEITLGRDLARRVGPIFCRGPLARLCKAVIYFFSGSLPSSINDEDLARLVKNAPEGISAKEIFHGCQIYKSKRLEDFDYGDPNLNMLKYNSTTPPVYNVSSTTTPSALYFSKNDWFLAEKQVYELAKQLPNVVDLYPVPKDTFSHLDFIFTRSASNILYNRMIKLMNSYSDQSSKTKKLS